MSEMDIERILKVAVRGGASDVILKTGSVPRFRFNGELVSLSDGENITPETMTTWIKHILPRHLSDKLNLLEDLDFSYQSKSGNRFRVNLFRQRQTFGLVLRVVSSHVKTTEELQLPPIFREFIKEKRGLILVTGATGSGKSTTLAAMIESINNSSPAHIVTIEDPIEFSFVDKKSTVQQREIGVDAASFPAALRSALRQNPDVILVGELRDRETTETALMAAETGHLVLSTLHTLDAVETMTRLLSYFPPHQHPALRIMLSTTLRAIVSQRLVPKKDKKGLVAAFEILVGSAQVKECILRGDDFERLHDAMRDGSESYGMRSFDQSLLELFRAGAISAETAIEFASRKEDLRLDISGVGK